MYIVGVDPGSVVTGFGVISVKNSSLRCMEYGIIRTQKDDPVEKRLTDIYLSLQSVFIKWEPQLISIEKVFLGKNIQSALKLGQARGVILLSACQSGAEIVEYSPTTVKKTIVGNGRASKDQVEFMVKSILCLGNEKIKDDAFDALSLALCAYNHG
jgi:crossover junction endodeoxyribonuclease RuvC